MEKEKIKGVIEAILFASGRTVTLRELEISLEIEQKQILDIISEMQEEYKMQGRGIEIVKVENGYTLSSKKEYHQYIYGVIDKRVKISLSQAALEVLAIIAYNPKITRAEIETIRGVGSDAALYRLMEHNLIETAGKLDLPGRPTAYKVTKEFLKKFGLNTLEDLPKLPKYKIDENRQIVIDEILEEPQKENTEEVQDEKQENLNEEVSQEGQEKTKLDVEQKEEEGENSDK
ncbi:MAG: SMC-Scp complex subunit ScpB [Clostridia bacterium]|nr:SMC-Scp complex subunit ScpB [Clostridia bacterium]